MKKIALLLVMSMVLSMTACGKTEEKKTEDKKTETDSNVEEDTQEETKEDEAASTDGTVGQTLLADFKSKNAEDAAMEPQAMADALLTNEVIQFAPATMEVEPGFLTGFSAEISGFEKGVMFSPMIGTIPFVGYIFTVAEGQDVAAFTEQLKTNADPRWNVCTQAEETIVEASDNTVFFLMCPTKFEEQ